MTDHNLGFLYAAYTVVWAGIFGYLLWLHMDQRKLAREMDVLKEVLDGERSDEE
jgi:CcmD family protein